MDKTGLIIWVDSFSDMGRFAVGLAYGSAFTAVSFNRDFDFKEIADLFLYI